MNSRNIIKLTASKFPDDHNITIIVIEQLKKKKIMSHN